MQSDVVKVFRRPEICERLEIHWPASAPGGRVSGDISGSVLMAVVVFSSLGI